MVVRKGKYNVDGKRTPLVTILCEAPDKVQPLLASYYVNTVSLRCFDSPQTLYRGIGSTTPNQDDHLIRMLFKLLGAKQTRHLVWERKWN